ncbi:uncharacterized protein LOC132739865 isoform X1 [Ruditapes philippinarum]|uniref:uncharacterized protein LOC132739865 isoform X1 n=1 Tax=Ruditapes philippinarum TaxID=129788 RepID=UPI00295C062C|nr:uncharacterized protein LOC132739865 isoform X1 [Ruditapes philippinarum]
MSKHIKFSGDCDDNIELSNHQTVATWKPVNSGGFAFSESELRPGDNITFKVEGSGRCDVGLLMGSKDQCYFSYSHEIRVHRKACIVEIHFNETGNQVCFEYDQRKEYIPTEKQTKFWIVACIQYGDLCVELMSQNDSLSKFCSTDKGKNVRLSEEKSKCFSISKNPASKCFLSEQIRPGSKVLLKCSPVTEGRRKICQRELKVFVSNKDPACSQKFPLVLIETLGKQDCDGTLIIFLSDCRRIEYKTPSGKRNAQNLDFDITNGIWVIFELYGVKIGEVQETVAESIDDVCGNNQVDSVCNYLRQKDNDLSEQSVNKNNGNNDNNRRERHRVFRSERKEANKANCKKNNGERFNIQTHYLDLAHDIDTINFSGHLLMRNIISFQQMDKIRKLHNQDTVNANMELLHIMRTKQINKCDIDEIVDKIGQQHLLKYFYPE